MEDKIEKD